MMYSSTPNPPSKFTATMWGKTITIELDHSDIDLNEVMDIFKGLAIASGFEISSWNNVIKDTASEIYDEEHEIVKEALDTTDDECNECNDEFENLRHSYEDYDGQFRDWENETPKPGYDWDETFTNESNIDAEEEMKKYAMDIIGQNGNEGTHYDEEEIVWGDEDELETPTDDYKGIHVSKPTFDWDNETNDILTNINDSITIIKDRMEVIDMRMDNIDEQLDILNADVANIEFNIQHPIKKALLNAKVVYDKSVIETERFNKVREAVQKYSDEVKEKHVPIKDFDIVDIETGEVSATNEVTNNGGFDGKGFKTPKVFTNEVRLGKWQTDNKTKEVVKLDKTKVRKGKIKDLKK